MGNDDPETVVPVNPVEVGIGWDESYPVFYIDSDDRPEVSVELGGHELMRFRAAQQEWDQMQNLILRKLRETGFSKF